MRNIYGDYALLRYSATQQDIVLTMKYFAYFIVFLLLATGLTLVSANHNGVCTRELRLLSEDEIKHRAITSILAAYPASIAMNKIGDITHFKAPSNPVFYTSTSDFIAKNSDCCQLKQQRNVDEGKIQSNERLIGVRSYFTAKYKVFFLQNGRVMYRMHSISSKISNCGDLIFENE